LSHHGGEEYSHFGKDAQSATSIPLFHHSIIPLVKSSNRQAVTLRIRQSSDVTDTTQPAI
jgi:hypothetical protein